MLKKFINYYKTSSPIAPLEISDEAKNKLYKKLRFQAFLAGTIGYSLYYVCRTSLNVVKKPILDSGALDATQLGIIGSALLFAYAIGKFVNGFLADYSNIKRFMATGLIVSALANFLMGVLGMASGAVISSAVLFISMSIMWAINGWSQAMGSPPAVIALSRWYPLNKRGTYYGFFSASHNIGEFFSFLFVGSLVATAGWQWGFFGSTLAGVLGVIFIIIFMHDTPESKGLPSVSVLANETVKKTDNIPVKEVQKLALRTPASTKHPSH